MPYTVNQLSKLAHVSVRTLHYYDEFGLLKPSFIARNGYRYYEEQELVQLQQILFYRELEFSLEDIKRILMNPNFNVATALDEQKGLLQLKRQRLDGLITAINATIKRMKNKQPAASEEMYDPFKDDDVKQYQQEVKERWGNTAAYQQSTARVSKMTKKEMEELKTQSKEFTQTLAAAMDKPPASSEVQQLIAEHYKGIQFFYDCPLSMYRTLGQMYVDDARFTAYYDSFRPGLAIFVRDAINHFCDVNEKNTKQ